MNKDILPFWQEIGTSTSIIAKNVSVKLGTPTSHTGTLDPMAQGVVLILTGEEYFNKEKYLPKDKIYEFSILFGFQTDTFDGLGLIEKVLEDIGEITKEKLKEVLENFKGFYHQKYPEFSSKKIEGKSLWEYKRLGLAVPEVYIDGEITFIEMQDFFIVDSLIEIQKIKDQISLVKGNFRQQEILSQYDATKFPDKFTKAKIKVGMTRGLYVRGLVRDICLKLNTYGIVVDLVRTADGEFTKDDCIRFNEYFAEELKNNPNLFQPNHKQF